MFTGIVTACGTVSRVDRDGDRLALTIEAPYPDLAVGDSIAVDGACLTIVETGDGWFRVEAVVTTRGRTRFGEMEVGERVNLERAMGAADRFGGHFVQGHVDGVGEVLGVRPEADAVLVDIAVPEDVAEVSVLYGSIAVDGVSMTVNAVPQPGVVQLSVIPYTREHTTMGSYRAGDRVHLEGDMIGKYVRQLLEQRGALTTAGGGDAVRNHRTGS
ncbi:MAG: riboflavin synthase [Gemmatimonadales bacterium]|nr:riboflavin synthase [Gemmatimonadales bacterium]NIN12803.1 riboflavin synthase [Gemmatimonadales bacterium]NIN48731.1 riboflavin synthase [Gemmatimonadales bacterium]NIP06195.1 riboflavin synthase [Gemmatimonadales bacterium]NIR01380.1 riboflavin synthase [Gemmatimonadales bacterium]